MYRYVDNISFQKYHKKSLKLLIYFERNGENSDCLEKSYAKNYAKI